ncbi:MAG: hypothetical protein HYV24_05040 [Deltaproteobacteria bacterium]|nr:hypothetical protein [Deltaproteobacteria bacterium]
MAEYNLGFSQKLIEAARMVAEDDLDSEDAARTVLYLSLLSCEITLKSLLEHAGFSVKEISKCSHDFNKLLLCIGKCRIKKEIGNGVYRWVPATRIRSIPVDPVYGNATIGTLLEAGDCGASVYPNQIRYGDKVRHFPPKLMLSAAENLLHHAKGYWITIRICQ